MDTPYPSTLGPDAGIIKVPGRPLYPCANDCETHGGMCRSYEKVSNPNTKCSNCVALGLSLGYGTQDVQWQITLGSDSGILEMGDYQDVCVNASVTGGLYHSGENVWQAGGKS